MKKTIITALCAILILPILSGCAGDALTLYNALFNNTREQSRTTMNISFDVSTEDFDGSLGATMNMLDGFGMNLDFDTIERVSDDLLRSESIGRVDGTFGWDGFGFYAGADILMRWDYTDENDPEFVITFSVPQLFSNIFAMAGETAPQFIEIDYVALMQTLDENFDYSQMVNMFGGAEMRGILMNALSEISVPLEVHNLSGGAQEFTISLTPRGTMNLFNDALRAIMQSELMDSFGELNGYIDTFFDVLDNVNYIGSRGSSFVFIVNADGHLDEYSMDIDFRIDIREWARVIADLTDDEFIYTFAPSGVVNIATHISGTITDDNSEIPAYLPGQTDENTLDLTEWLYEINQPWNGGRDERWGWADVDEYRYGLTLYHLWGGGPIELYNPLVVVDNVIMAPLREIAPHFGFPHVLHDEEINRIWIFGSGHRIIQTEIGARTAVFEGETHEYGAYVQYIDGVLYAPIDMLSDHSWDVIMWFELYNGKAGIIGDRWFWDNNWIACDCPSCNPPERVYDYRWGYTNVDVHMPGLNLYNYGDWWGAIYFEYGIVEIDGVIMVPVRQLAWQFDFANVIFDEETERIWIVRWDGSFVRMQIGSRYFVSDGEAFEFGAYVQYVGSRAYVPLDMFLAFSDFTVDWHSIYYGRAGIIRWSPPVWNDDWYFNDWDDWEYEHDWEYEYYLRDEDYGYYWYYM